MSFTWCKASIFKSSWWDQIMKLISIKIGSITCTWLLLIIYFTRNGKIHFLSLELRIIHTYIHANVCICVFISIRIWNEWTMHLHWTCNGEPGTRREPEKGMLREEEAEPRSPSLSLSPFQIPLDHSCYFLTCFGFILMELLQVYDGLTQTYIGDEENCCHVVFP